MAKPASGTPLNTSHSLYPSLKAVWAFLEGSGTTSVDSRNSYDLTLDAVATWATDGAGDAVVSIDSAAVRPIIISTGITLVDSSSWSIVFRVVMDSANLRGGIAGRADSAFSFIWLNESLSIGFRVRNVTGTFYDFSSSGFTTVADYALSYDTATGTLSAYKDGSLLSSMAYTGSIELTTLGNALSSGAYALAGDFSYFYIWDGKSLTSSEVLDIKTNPYEIFESSSTRPSRRRRLQRGGTL